jgi:hypothetical protein
VIAAAGCCEPRVTAGTVPSSCRGPDARSYDLPGLVRFSTGPDGLRRGLTPWASRYRPFGADSERRRQSRGATAAQKPGLADGRAQRRRRQVSYIATCGELIGIF